MQYLRKVTCPSLNIESIFDDQAKALRLFTRCKDLGYHDATLSDLFLAEDSQVELNDSEIIEILEKVKKKD